MATFSDIVKAALLDLNAIDATTTPSSADGELGLSRLNRLIDQWALERLTIYYFVRTTGTITANDGTYTVGSGGDINIARPIYFNAVNFIDTSTDPDTELPLHRLTDEMYAAIAFKAQTSTYPTSWHYNPAWPTATLNFWPIPTSSTLQYALYVPTALTQASALSTTFTLPPGYQRFMETALAVELASAFGRPLTEDLLLKARDAKQAVQRRNLMLQDMTFDAGAIIQGRGYGWYDIRSG